jgi:membrane-associated phospholipid phosphatase
MDKPMNRHRMQAGALVLTLAASCAEGSEALQNAGDILRYALPLTGLAISGLRGDWEGARQWALSGATTLGAVAIGKSTTGKLRPDGSGDTSYPSGHAAWAFWGAAYLDTRYGPVWGWPAYGLAALTAYSRIDSGSHFPDDVLAGASIALLSNWYWVRPLANNTAIEPMVTAAGALGVRLTIADMPLRAAPTTASRAEPRFGFEYQMAWASVATNEVRASGAGKPGTRFDLADLSKIDDPTVASIVRIEWTPDPRHSVRLVFAPFATRDRSQLAAPTQFDGVLYPAGETVQIDYRFYDYRIGYRYRMNPTGAAQLRVGVTLQAARTSFSLDDGQGRRAEASQWSVLPLAHADIALHFGARWRAEASFEGMQLGEAGFGEAEGTLRFRPAEDWEFAGGYAVRHARLDAPSLANEAAYRMPFLLFIHRW